MGVTGLWQLIGSTGKPVPLDSLEGKILAVDVSVWLHQLSKGMRDGAGNPVPNAHLHGLFTRICKLLHCRIKPIFVFDGVAPELKKKTLASRRNKRDDAEENSAAMQRKILTNLIRNQALKEALGEGSPTKVPPIPKGANAGAKKDTIFELPPLPETSKAYLTHTFEDDDRGIEKRELQEFIQEEFSDLSSVDVESEDFKSLPAELQHELIEDLRASKKNYNLSKIVELPEDSKDFSNFQMEKLLKYNKLNTRLEQVRKELNTRQTRDLGKHYGQDYYGMNVDSRRVVSEDTSHYVLIKGLKKKKEMEKEEKRRKLQLAKVLEHSEDSSNADELLQESEHDSLKEIDFRKSEFQQVMQKVEMSDDKKTEVKKIGDDVERFKAVIEFDSGSDSDDSEMSEDAELQYAIALSLKEQSHKKSESIFPDNKFSGTENLMSGKSESKNNDVNNSSKSADKNGCKSVSKTSKLKDQKQTGISKINQNRSKVKSSSSGTLVPSESSERFKRTTRSSRSTEQTQDKERNSRIETKDSITTKIKTSNILKRRKSNMSNDSLEDKRPKILTRRKSNASCDSLEEKKTTGKDIEERRSTILKRRKSNASNDSVEEKVSKKRKLETESVTTTVIQVDDDKEEWPKRRTVIGEPDDGLQLDDERNEETSESEEEFLEVAIDLTKVKEDELFPASMFEVKSTESSDMGRKQPKSKLQEIRNENGTKNVVAYENKDKPSNETTVNDGEDSDSVEAYSDSEAGKDATAVDAAVVVSDDDDNYDENNVDDNDDEYDVDDKVAVDDGEASSRQADGSEEEDNESDEEEDKESDENDPDNDDDERGNKESEKAIMIREQEMYINQEHSKTEIIATPEKVRDSIDVEENLAGRDTGDELDDVELKSPKTQDLVKAFKSLEEPNIRGLKASYEKETRQLIQEQGRQARMASSITDQMHTDAQELLQLFGIPFIVSPSEAEAQCAQLDKANLTQGTITDDSDIWLFGGKVVFKNFFNQAKYVECFKDVHIRSQLGLSREHLINIALLCGSDYTEGLQGVGPVTAMEILAQFPGEGVEGLVQLRSWWEAAQKQFRVPTESKLLSKLRNIDLNPGFPSVQVVDAYLCPNVEDSAEKFTWALPDLDQLRLFTNSKLGWSRDKVDELILPVLKRLNYKQTQRAINSFFQPEVYIQPAKMKSKRLQNVVNKFLNVEQPTDSTGQDTQNVDKIKPKSAKGRGKSKGKVNADNENDNETTEAIDDGTDESKSTDKPGKGKGTVKGKKGKGKAKNDESAQDIDKDGDTENSVKGKTTGKSRARTKASIKGKTVLKNVDEENEEKTKEVSKYFDDKKMSGKGKSGKGSNKGKGKGRGKRSINEEDSKSDFESSSIIDLIDTKLTQEDDISDGSGTSDTSDSDSDSDASDNDENEITESSLSVAEILGLKIGDSKFEKAAKTNENIAGSSGVSQQARVYESGLNVGEIMKLQSGDKEQIETDHLYSEEDMEINDDNENDDTEKNEDSEWEDDDFYKNEGGFIREDSEEMSIEDNIAKTVSSDMNTKPKRKNNDKQATTEKSSTNNNEYIDNTVIQPESSEVNFGKNNQNLTKSKEEKESKNKKKQISTNVENSEKNLHVEDVEGISQDTKTPKRVTRGRKSQNDKTKEKTDNIKVNEETENEAELDKLKMTDTNVIESKEKLLPNKGKQNIKKGKDIDNSEANTKTTKKNTRGKKAVKAKEAAAKEAELELVPLEQSTEPIKRIVSGVPWADLGKKKGRKGKAGGGLGGLKRNMEPVERLEKKGKTAKAAARYTAGCVNLSESDSDSSS